jgi:hypothetical protein
MGVLTRNGACNDHATLRQQAMQHAGVAVALAPDTPARCWQVQYPGIDPMEVIFAPKATRVEVAALYPGAKIEPLPEIERGPNDGES